MWSGFCILGLTLNELTDLARASYEQDNHTPARSYDCAMCAYEETITVKFR